MCMLKSETLAVLATYFFLYGGCKRINVAVCHCAVLITTEIIHSRGVKLKFTVGQKTFWFKARSGLVHLKIDRNRNALIAAE